MSPRRPPHGRTAQALPRARALALEALTSCLRGQDAQPALDQALSKAQAQEPLDTRDAALATELAYGTLRQYLRLEFILSRYLKNPGGLPAPMRLVLAVAAYEILFLDKIPPYASANWATEHVKTVISPRLAKVSNAVLRAISDLGQCAHEDDFYRTDDPEDRVFLSRRYGAPLWLVDLWTREMGQERTTTLLTAPNQAPPLGLRLRFGVPGARERHAALRENDQCLAATQTGVALATPPEDLADLLSTGSAVRQSLAGQQALAALGAADWPRPVWDACCGRGGKSFMLADAAPGTILASDPNRRRLRGLRSEMDRLGITNVAPFRTRAEHFYPRTAPTSILLDAPCTGLGVLSRRPDAALRRTPGDVADLAAVQSRLLNHAASVLAPGGLLAYVTCTISHDENEGQIKSFLDQNPGFTLDAQFTTPADSPLREFFFGALLRKS